MIRPVEPHFPALDAKDTVVREAQALFLRYRLMRCLTDGNGIRRDLRGAEPEPDLVAEMIRQLVPGVDAWFTSPQVDWPIPAGVRLETLYASPWLASFVEQAAVGGGHAAPAGSDMMAKLKLYLVPRNATEFAAQFHAKTGIAPECEAMHRNYRITPIELGHIAQQVRGDGDAPSLAYLLLCSRHFNEAVREAPFLGHRDDRLAFRRPLVDGFMLLAELEREALMVEDLGGLNLLSVRRIRQWLDNKNVGPLAKALRENLQLKRLFDYQMIGTDALAGFSNGDVGGYVPMHTDLRVAAAARGTLDVDLITALTKDGELARATLRGAFPDRHPDLRSNVLDNDEPAIFYGLNKTLPGAMQADLGHAFQHGDERHVRGDDRERQALIADAIVAHADKVLQDRNDAKSKSLADKQSKGTNRQRDAQAHGQLMLSGGSRPLGLELPPLTIFGSAPRADIRLWIDRWGDAPFWQAFLDRRLGDLSLGLDEQERRAVNMAFQRIETLFGMTLERMCPENDMEARTDAVRVACDLATAISAISTNRHFGPAIRAWIQVYDVNRDQLITDKTHGRRRVSGLSHIVKKPRVKTGVPSAGVKRSGTPRNQRGDTRKRKALRALKPDPS